MNDPRNAAAHALINLRGRAGLTQKELADTARVTERTISSFENGEVWPRVATLSKLEDALGLESGFFLKLKGSGVYQTYEAQSVTAGPERVAEAVSSQKAGVGNLSDIDLIEELKSRLLSADRDRSWLMTQVETAGQRVEELEDEVAKLRSQVPEEGT